MKIKISSIMAVLIYHIVFVKITYINFYYSLSYLLIGIVAIYLMMRFKKIDKSYKKVNVILIVFCFIVLFSSILNRNNMFRGFIYVLKITEIIMFLEYCKTIGQDKNVIKIFYKLTLIYCIITDIILIFIPSMFNRYDQYLIGNKFNVSYLHITLFVLYLQNKMKYSTSISKNIVKVLLYFLFIFFISKKIECSTAIVGSVIIMLLYILPKDIKDKLYNPKVFIISLIVSCSILLVFSNILNNKYISYFIVNVLHEDLTLTGRMNIYEEIDDVILPKWKLGYGYGNSNEVISKLINYPNSQNGLLECIVNYGTFGTIVLIILIYNIIKKLRICENRDYYYPILANLYMYALLACIEITIGITFISLLAIINICNNQNEERIYLTKS